MAHLTPRSGSVEAFGGWVNAGKAKVYAAGDSDTPTAGNGGAATKRPTIRRGGAYSAEFEARDHRTGVFDDLVPHQVLPPPPDSWDPEEFAQTQSITLDYTVLNEPLGFHQLTKFLLRTGPSAPRVGSNLSGVGGGGGGRGSTAAATAAAAAATTQLAQIEA